MSKRTWDLKNKGAPSRSTDKHGGSPATVQGVVSAARAVKNELEAGLAEVISRFSEKVKQEDVDIFRSCVSQLEDLCGLVAGGKEESRIMAACSGFLGSMTALLVHLTNLRDQVEAAWSAEEETAKLKDPEPLEVLKMLMAGFQKKMSGVEEQIEVAYRRPEEETRNQLGLLQQELDGVERRLLEKQGELEGLTDAAANVDLESLAHQVREEMPNTTTQEQFQEMSRRMVKLQSNEESKQALEQEIAELERRAGDTKKKVGELGVRLSELEKERLFFEKSDLLPLRDNIDTARRMMVNLGLAPETLVAEAPQGVLSESEEETAPESAGEYERSSEAEVVPEIDPLEKVIVGILDIITSPPVSAAERSLGTVLLVARRAEIFSASRDEYRRAEEVVRSAGSREDHPSLVFKPTKTQPRLSLTPFGRAIASHWREDLGWPREMETVIVSAMSDVQAARKAKDDRVTAEEVLVEKRELVGEVDEPPPETEIAFVETRKRRRISIPKRIPGPSVSPTGRNPYE